MSEAGQQVDLGNTSVADTNTAGRLQDGLAKLGKDAFFDFNGALVRGKDADFVAFQLGGREALSVSEGLLTLVVRRDEREVGTRDLNVISEDVVEANLEGMDA